MYLFLYIKVLQTYHFNEFEWIFQVDLKSAGKTALQVACHQGHKDIVHVLLDAGANLELQDDDGDTALHYSAFGYED